MSAVVTGDAVVLGLQPARLPSRALALAIDLVVVWSTYLLISLGLALATASLDEAAVMAVSIAAFLLVLVGGPIAVETLSHGRSLGKLACGLRVVRDDGGPIRFRHALVRGAMGVVELLMTFGVVACIASLMSERGRRVGDVFAGTLVVRERIPAGSRMAAPPPAPWLAGRFGQLDLSAVPEELWLAVRQYLSRAGQLDPQVGRAMAERLADDLVTRTGTPPPTGMPASVYLAGVVQERQARDARRAFRPAGPAAGGEGARGVVGAGGAMEATHGAGGAGGSAGSDFGAGASVSRPGSDTGRSRPGSDTGGSRPGPVTGVPVDGDSESARRPGAGTGTGTETGFAPPA